MTKGEVSVRANALDIPRLVAVACVVKRLRATALGVSNVNLYLIMQVESGVIDKELNSVVPGTFAG